MRSLVATFTLLFALALAAPAAGQVPSSTMTVTISGLPAELSGLASNATVRADFTVDVTATNLVCPTASSIPVTIEVTAGGAPAFMTVVADPTSGAVTAAAGPHPTVSGNVPSTLIVTLTEVTANASVPITVKATAGPAAGCQGAGSNPTGSAEATVYANVTAPPPPPPPTPEPQESPGPGALMGIVAAVGAAALWRRRHA